MLTIDEQMNVIGHHAVHDYCHALLARRLKKAIDDRADDRWIGEILRAIQCTCRQKVPLHTDVSVTGNPAGTSHVAPVRKLYSVVGM
jgi:hypothetical protein